MTADGPTGLLDGLCEVELLAGPQADPAAPADLLFELPHAATRRAHYDAVRRALRGRRYPDRLEQFFFVNTDVGSPEYALAAARMIVDRDGPARAVGWLGRPVAHDPAARARLKIRIVRCLIPRTFVDCNRDVELDRDGFREARFTAALPAYVDDPYDAGWLTARHDAYRALVESAYAETCGAGGRALQLHTYAPRSIGIDEIGDDIVEALHRAYEPAVLASWPVRPDVDLITETVEGEQLAPEDLVRRLAAGYADLGIDARRSETYRLHPATLGHRHSARYPGRVAVVEISRGLLAEPFRPFEEMTIGGEKAQRMAAPIAAACLETACRPGDR